jgi:hypothetical protein
VNKDSLESHKKVPIRVEMDEMGSFYQDKSIQCGCGGLTTGVVKSLLFGVEPENIRIWISCWNCLSRLP